MRHIFSNHSEVAHVWASREQSDGRCSNMHFDGDAIYSYGTHFKIAEFCKMPNGKTVVLFNADSYSSSTSGHQNLTRYAIDTDVYKIITLPSSDWYRYDHGKKYFTDQVEYYYDQASRAREFARMHIESVERFKAKLSEWAKLHKRQAAFKVTKVHKAIEERAIRMEEQANVRHAERKQREEAQRIAREKQQAINLKNFENEFGSVADHYHKTGRLPDSQIMQSLGLNSWETPAYCRIDGNEVVTSKSARVPLRHAKRLLQLVVNCKNKGIEYMTPNMPAVRVGLYKLDKIFADGSLKVGCHRIEWSEVEYLSKELAVTGI